MSCDESLKHFQCQDGVFGVNSQSFSPLCWRKTGVGYFMFVWYYDGCDLSFRTYKICWLQLELMHPMRCALGSMPWNEASRMRQKFSEMRTSHRIGDEPCCLQGWDGKHAKFSWATVASTVPSRASSLQGWRHTFAVSPLRIWLYVPSNSKTKYQGPWRLVFLGPWSQILWEERSPKNLFTGHVSLFNLCCIWSCLAISYWFIISYTYVFHVLRFHKNDSLLRSLFHGYENFHQAREPLQALLVENDLRLYLKDTKGWSIDCMPFYKFVFPSLFFIVLLSLRILDLSQL